MKSITSDESHTRKFYDLPTRSGDDVSSAHSTENKDKLAKYIRDSIIGKDVTFLSPFGRKNVVYCDYTASGKVT